ncbi:MAG: transglycosylase SLT domain-containing protein, partial [Nocardioides sp.]
MTRPVGSPALSDQEAASHVRRSSWEPRPQNYTANHRVPTGDELAAFHAAQASVDEWNVNPYAQQVTGDFTGTTEEIIQWAAWKWGVDEDVLRAVASTESTWEQDAVARDGQYYSYGITQVLDQWAGTDPLARLSTAFNADFYGASLRFVFDGRNRWLM